MPPKKSTASSHPKWSSADDKHLTHLILTKKVNPIDRSKATILKLLEEPQWRGRPYKAFAQLIRKKFEKVEADRILQGGRGFHSKKAGEYLVFHILRVPIAILIYSIHLSNILQQNPTKSLITIQTTPATTSKKNSPTKAKTLNLTATRLKTSTKTLKPKNLPSWPATPSRPLLLVALLARRQARTTTISPPQWAR